jgi:transposase-like protein
MARHFLLTPASRDFTLLSVDKLSPAKVHAFFVESRWGTDGKQECPDCGVVAAHYWVKTRMQWRCRDVACGRSFSVTSGTKFADRKMSLKMILKGMVVFASNVKGISACSMARQIGVTYQAAFVMLHKLREGIMDCVDKTPLDGLIHIDGAHLSGRVRKPVKKVDSTKTQARDKVPYSEGHYHPNRRIVMVMREVGPGKRQGAVRTIVEVVRAETAEFANALAKRYIKKGAHVMTDESGAYAKFSGRYKHETVNHTIEFSTKEWGGVNNNIAESFFARMRRMVIGQVHRITPKYMLDYVTEIGWREDVRRQNTKTQVSSLINMSSKTMSKWWRGYWQGHHRQEEIYFEIPKKKEKVAPGTQVKPDVGPQGANEMLKGPPDGNQS